MLCQCCAYSCVLLLYACCYKYRAIGVSLCYYQSIRHKSLTIHVAILLQCKIGLVRAEGGVGTETCSICVLTLVHSLSLSLSLPPSLFLSPSPFLSLSFAAPPVWVTDGVFRLEPVWRWWSQPDVPWGQGRQRNHHSTTGAHRSIKTGQLLTDWIKTSFWHDLHTQPHVCDKMNEERVILWSIC